MKFNDTLTSNWKNAFRGLRNPMESWKQSDSCGGIYSINDSYDNEAGIVYLWMKANYPDLEEYSLDWDDKAESYYQWFESNIINNAGECQEYFFIGPNDMDLAQRMIAAGNPNDKFLRQIFVSVDITAPLYWWKEMSTYKIGTTANSTSTMHKLASTHITLDCFEIDDLRTFSMVDNITKEQSISHIDFIKNMIDYLEKLRVKYIETKDQKYWKELIRWLPNSWLQTRTWTANYEVLRNIYHWRKEHKLTEWKTFCNWIKTLPYAEELILYHN